MKRMLVFLFAIVTLASCDVINQLPTSTGGMGTGVSESEAGQGISATIRGGFLRGRCAQCTAVADAIRSHPRRSRAIAASTARAARPRGPSLPGPDASPEGCKIEETALRCAPSQRDDQVADLGGLGEEWVVAGVELHDACCSTGELALQVGRGAPVLRADEVRRAHVLPGR